MDIRVDWHLQRVTYELSDFRDGVSTVAQQQNCIGNRVHDHRFVTTIDAEHNFTVGKLSSNHVGFEPRFTHG